MISHSHSLKYNFYRSNHLKVLQDREGGGMIPPNTVPSWCQSISPNILFLCRPPEWGVCQQLRSQTSIWRLLATTFSPASARVSGQPLNSTGTKGQSLNCLPRADSLRTPGVCSRTDRNICGRLFKKKKFWYTENALLLIILRKMLFASK